MMRFRNPDFTHPTLIAHVREQIHQMPGGSAGLLPYVCGDLSSGHAGASTTSPVTEERFVAKYQNRFQPPPGHAIQPYPIILFQTSEALTTFSERMLTYTI
ncbi:MAG: hypothetical protein HQL96_08985 [Magnetococcales bacterium]|nr:hypothetical protein [Magnetococcales bacterium]